MVVLVVLVVLVVVVLRGEGIPEGSGKGVGAENAQRQYSA